MNIGMGAMRKLRYIATPTTFPLSQSPVVFHLIPILPLSLCPHPCHLISHSASLSCIPLPSPLFRQHSSISSLATLLNYLPSTNHLCLIMSFSLITFPRPYPLIYLNAALFPHHSPIMLLSFRTFPCSLCSSKSPHPFL